VSADAIVTGALLEYANITGGREGLVTVIRDLSLSYTAESLLFGPHVGAEQPGFPSTANVQTVYNGVGTLTLSGRVQNAPLGTAPIQYTVQSDGTSTVETGDQTLAQNSIAGIVVYPAHVAADRAGAAIASSAFTQQTRGTPDLPATVLDGQLDMATTVGVG
jgi:hypothetical protein